MSRWLGCPTSSQDEALACYGVSRKDPRSISKSKTVLCTLDATPNIPRHASLTRREHRGSHTTSSEHLLPSCSRQDGLFPCLVWNGFPTFPVHLRMRPVSRGNSRRRLVGGVTCRKTPISRLTLRRTRCPDTSSKATLWMNAQNEGSLTPPCIIW